ncbi:MAG TPA: hypothetical protein VHV28_03945 [Solirubrobacteraceae bacterium]|jgi:hypothetical protein|nr:hypothetical protein [Solirubrobacteraceae bacterium]
MPSHSIHIQSPKQDRGPDAHRIRIRRRPAAALTAGTGQHIVAAPNTDSPDHPEATRQAGGARILRRWSVTDLIARAGGAPRAFA